MPDSNAIRDLADAARAARANAYAPYSRFHVGAAVLLENGASLTGANVENASFGLTCCAERVAVFKAVSEGETAITAVAIVTDVSPPAAPCGACRQVICELAPAARIVFGAGGRIGRTWASIRELLPEAFDGSWTESAGS